MKLNSDRIGNLNSWKKYENRVSGYWCLIIIYFFTSLLMMFIFVIISVTAATAHERLFTKQWLSWGHYCCPLSVNTSFICLYWTQWHNTSGTELIKYRDKAHWLQFLNGYIVEYHPFISMVYRYQIYIF